MGARERFEQAADYINSLYSGLEDSIFKLIINALKDGDYQHVDQSDVVMWQAQQLQKIGRLNQDAVKLMAQVDGLSEDAVKDLIKFHGMQIIDEIDGQLERATKQSQPLSADVTNKLDALADQTWTDLQNNVNESLVTRNYQQSAVTKAYRQILTESTMATVSGATSHEDAVKHALYKVVDQGLPTRLVDKAGHNWSIDGYTRMVTTTTVNRTYNDLRLQRMKDFDMHLALMSSHPNSRPACAWIQGHVVNLVPPESDDYDPKYDSIYNHDYGKPSGTLGINCRHILFPYVPGMNTNHQPQYDPKEAIKNGKLVQGQRARERAIRDAKKRLKAAEELGDAEMVSRTKTLIRARQAKLRDYIKETNAGHSVPILTRDYDRERINQRFINRQKESAKITTYRANELDQLKKTYGKHGFPETVQEYQRLLYNKDTGQAMHAYVQARKNHTVEPVVRYTDYVDAKKRLDKEIVGMKTSTGQVIKSYSDHTFDRIFGVRKDPKGKRRIGVSIDQIKQALQSQKHFSSEQRNSETYVTDQARVIVNIKGNIVTLIPRKEK